MWLVFDGHKWCGRTQMNIVRSYLRGEKKGEMDIILCICTSLRDSSQIIKITEALNRLIFFNEFRQIVQQLRAEQV